MTWSLRIYNGDLVLRGTQLDVVTGTNKLTQDLRCAIMERMGTDDLHPAFGSLIDGGRTVDGREVQSVIGTSDWNHIVLVIKEDIRRIANDLQKSQYSRGQRDRFTYGKSTQEGGEVLGGITNVSLSQIEDRLVVNIGLRSLSGVDADLRIPVASGTITR